MNKLLHRKQLFFVLPVVTIAILLLSLFAVPFSVAFGGVVSQKGEDVKVTYITGEESVQSALPKLWTTVETARLALASRCDFAASLSLAVPAVGPSGVSPASGHLASQIVVTLNGVTTTAQQVISTLDGAVTQLAIQCTLPPANNNAPTGSATLTATNDLTGIASDADYAGEVYVHYYVDGVVKGAVVTAGNKFTVASASLFSDTGCHTIDAYAIDADAAGNYNNNGDMPRTQGNVKIASGLKSSGCPKPNTFSWSSADWDSSCSYLESCPASAFNYGTCNDIASYEGTGNCKESTTSQVNVYAVHRAVSCIQSDGATVADTNCAGTKPVSYKLCDFVCVPYGGGSGGGDGPVHVCVQYIDAVCVRNAVAY